MGNRRREQPAGVAKCTCGFLPSGGMEWNENCPEHGRAAVAKLRKARAERGTRTVQRVDGRAGRTKTARTKKWWAVEWQVTAKPEVWRETNIRSGHSARDCKEWALKNGLGDWPEKWRVVAVVERRTTVEVVKPGSPIDKDVRTASTK